MSPGLTARPSPTRTPPAIHPATRLAILRASATRGLVSEVVSKGASHPSGTATSSGSISGQISTRPGARLRTAVCTVGTGSSSPRSASGSLNT